MDTLRERALEALGWEKIVGPDNDFHGYYRDAEGKTEFEPSDAELIGLLFLELDRLTGKAFFYYAKDALRGSEQVIHTESKRVSCKSESLLEALILAVEVARVGRMVFTPEESHEIAEWMLGWDYSPGYAFDVWREFWYTDKGALVEGLPDFSLPEWTGQMLETVSKVCNRCRWVSINIRGLTVDAFRAGGGRQFEVFNNKNLNRNLFDVWKWLQGQTTPAPVDKSERDSIDKYFG